ncbi:MAG: hypothetical protein KKD01_12130 [Proteobacteria bacterium]|nr:hypothetical protein [Pseudomonadota bacterium]MBU1137824.1 hypothetical protein [Pseudomonadota bacterium]MBU1233498.1 hypothetical protein [Pseudomonadota bacterium]MBU1418769.1 hypothetical protein [Pseudomonadota bacterium]MBU1455467.1 hypothetical protein [Pseudomonadota bacterium]
MLAIHSYLPAVGLHKRSVPLVRYLEEKTGKTIRIDISGNEGILTPRQQEYGAG